MAKRDYLVSIDLNKNELLNAKLQNLGVLPTLTTGDTGYFGWYNNTANFWTGTGWKSLEETIATSLVGTYSSTTLNLTPVTGSLSGSTFTLSAATSTNAGLLTGALYDRLNNTVINSDYIAYSILVANTAGTPIALSADTNTVIGRIFGNFQAISIDNDLTVVSSLDDTLASAKAIRAYVNSVASPTGHTHYQLYQPNGSNPFVYTDNSGTLHIDGNIVQSGSSYNIHAQDIYTTGNTITLRDGAVAGLSGGQYVGLIAKLYDGANDGQFVFDNTGTARVGDIGSLQPISTRIESPSDGYIAYWENANTRLNFKQLTSADITDIGSWSGNTNIVTVGTITTGTWHGSILESQYGGTGINNGGRTITISGNSGTFNFINASTTLSITGNTGVSGTNTGDQTITLTGEATGSGTGSFAVTLTNSAVIGKVLSGYTATTGTVSATDSILVAIQHLGYDQHVPVTLATNSGLSLSGQQLALGTPSYINGTSTNSVTTSTHTHALSGVTNAQLVNSSITIGSTIIALGGSTAILSGLTSVYASTFTGDFVGNASTATKLNNPRTIAISGDTNGTGVSFDGTANITIGTTLPNITTGGTFTTVVVNAKGQVTSGSTAAALNKYAVSITGNSITTSFPVTHNLGSVDITTYIKDAVSLAKVEVEEVITNINTLTLNFNVAPITGKVYRVVIIG